MVDVVRHLDHVELKLKRWAKACERDRGLMVAEEIHAAIARARESGAADHE